MIKNGEAASILLVDDDVDICRNMSDILSDLGYEVDVAHDGTSALKHVHRRTYDVALLDLKMPGMDGLTLYQEMKKLRPEIASILVSAYVSERVAQEAVTSGIIHVLPKPIDLPLLMRRVEASLDQPLVLIVDDDRDLCHNLWDLLHEAGYRVSLAHGEAEAGERLKEHTYQIALVDMKLPDGDGGQVLHKVRLANPQARVIVITGATPEIGTHAEQLLAEGAEAICYKPFDVPQLLAAIQRRV